MKKPLLILIILLAVFFALWNQATRRRWGIFEAYMCSETAKPFFKTARSPEGLLVTPGRRSALEFSFLMPKPAGVKRVLVIGESAAALLARPGKDTFADIFATRTGGRVEVINCGMGGYDSSRILPVFREALEYSPDLILLLSANNEVGPRIEACPNPAGFFRAGWRWLRAAFFSLGQAWRAGSAAEIERTYKARLGAMAALAADRGVPLLIFALPYNPAFPPAGPMPLEDAAFSDGFALLESGDHAGAARRLEEFLAARPGDAFGLYYLGLASRRAGDAARAKLFFERSVEADSLRDRTGAARNAAVREAARRGGACLADLEGELAGVRSPLADGVHWHQRYDKAAALAARRGLAACPAAAVFLPARAADATGALRRQEKATPARLRQEAGDMLNYAAAYLLFQPPIADFLNSRTLAQLEGACARDAIFIKEALASEPALAAALKNNIWVGDLRSGAGTLLPKLRSHAGRACGRPPLYGAGL
jgi:hypothetical protein